MEAQNCDKRISLYLILGLLSLQFRNDDIIEKLWRWVYIFYKKSSNRGHFISLLRGDYAFARTGFCLGKQRRDAAKQGAETNGAEEDAEELADGSEEGLRVEGIRIGWTII